MRALEVISAIVAETLIEMGVLIFPDPPEVHWPNGLISKLAMPVCGKKGGKNVQKNKHGIFGELVSKLAPTIPPASATQNSTKIASKKGFKNPAKIPKTSTEQCAAPANGEEASGSVDTGETNLHQGLPAQGRRGQCNEIRMHLIDIHNDYHFLRAYLLHKLNVACFS